MRLTKRISAVWLVVILAVAVLLPILAAVQYRWLGELSQAELERMQTDIRTGSEQLRQDFDKEVARVFLTFRIDANKHGSGPSTQLAAGYQSWTLNSPYTKLVRAVLLAERSRDGTFRLACFRPESKELQSCEWPAELARWRERIEHLQTTLTPEARDAIEKVFGHELKGKEFSGTTVTMNLAPLIADEVPALFIPFASSEARGKEPPAVGYTIVELDLEYLQRELFPALAQKHFAWGGRLDYNLSVVRRAEPLNPLYQSDASLRLGAPTASDAVMEFFSLRVEDIRSQPLRGLFPSISGREGADVTVRRNFSSMTLYTEPPDASHPAITAGTHFETGRWLLMVAHRAGSVEKAVAGVRRRNLALSSGVLVLLLTSVVLVVVLTHRSRRLARQQMIFVAGVSHELRTPLSIIRSAGENLAAGIIADSSQVKHYGDLIKTEGTRLSEMLEQILGFAGIQSKRKLADFQPVEIEGLIETALDRCGLTRGNSEFKVEQSIERPLPTVMGDAEALCGAVENLLSNAMKYCGEHRWIGVNAHTRRPGSNSELEITIEDHGLGIAARDLAHIFEPFYRGESIVDAQIRGNGLGLSLFKHIIEAHGGRILVKSTLGQGSAFTIRLPVAEHLSGCQ